MQKGVESEKKCLNKPSYFTLFEIVVTVVVVVLAILGIYGLYPVGLNTQQQALGSSFANDAAEHFLRLSASHIKEDVTWANVYANEKPGTIEPKIWRDNFFINSGYLKITPTNDFDRNSDNNNGFFLLEHIADSMTQFKGILRAWKAVTEDEGNAKNIVLNIQLDWPYDVPYGTPGRNHESFSLEVYKPPQIGVEDYRDCLVAKDHGGGYSTTLSSVVENEDDNSYTVVLTVEYNACDDPDCQELSHYSIEADAGTYFNIDFSGIEGELNVGPDLPLDSFSGFGISDTSRIGGEIEGNFTVTYSLEELQEQQVSAFTGDNPQIVTFSVGEFEYIMSCTTNDADRDTLVDATIESCPDIETGITHTYDNFEIKFFCEDVELKSIGEFDIRGIKIRSKDGTTTKITTRIGDNWTNLSIPEEVKPLNDLRVKQSRGWSDWISSDADCGRYNENPPAFPNDSFHRPDRKVNNYFCYGIGSENLPIDLDGDELTYTISDGPSWLYWDDDIQQVAGTPSEVGIYTWTISVDDGCYKAEAKLTIAIVP